MNRARGKGWRVAAVGAVAGALLLGTPMIPVASAQPESGRTFSATAVGNTYGGLTSKGLPVIVDMNAKRTTVVRVVAALHLTCTSPSVATVPDKYTQLHVTRAGRFRTSFGPFTQRNDDGTTTDYQGRMSGLFNSARTRITGTWQFTATDHDATGAVTDTCTSGALTWSAKQ